MENIVERRWKSMVMPDMKKILELKQQAMRRCEDRIKEAAAKPPCMKKFTEQSDYGVTRSMKSKYGL